MTLTWARPELHTIKPKHARPKYTQLGPGQNFTQSSQNRPGQSTPKLGQAKDIDMGQARTSHNQAKTGNAKVPPNWARPRRLTLTWARPELHTMKPKQVRPKYTQFEPGQGH